MSDDEQNEYDPVFLKQVAEFLTKEFGEDVDGETAAGFIDAMQDVQTPHAARLAIMEMFELSSIDEVVLSELACKHLLQMITTHKNKIVGNLLLDQAQQQMIKTELTDGLDTIKQEIPVAGPPPAIQNTSNLTYDAYQKFTHNEETEKRKKEILTKEGAAVAALAGEIPADRPKIVNARELVYGSVSNAELLAREMDHLKAQDEAQLEQAISFVKTKTLQPEIKQERGRERRPASPVAERNRDRDYGNNNKIDEAYLQTNNCARQGELSPLQHKVYRATAEQWVASKPGWWVVNLIEFPGIKGNLPKNMIIPGKENPLDKEIRQIVQEGCQLYVKVLSDYESLLRAETARQQKYGDKMREVSVTVSIADVDQSSGRDLNPYISFAGASSSNTTGRGQAAQQSFVKRSNFSGLSDLSLKSVQTVGNNIRASSQERWKQGRANDGLANRPFTDGRPGLDGRDKRQHQQRENNNDELELSDDDDFVDIDITDLEPKFLQGFNNNIQALTQNSIDSMRLVQEDGDLFAAARNQAELATSRRLANEERIKAAVGFVAQQEGHQERLQDIHKQWSDPLLAPRSAEHISSEYTDLIQANSKKLQLAQQFTSDITRQVVEEGKLIEQQRLNGVDTAIGSNGQHVVIPKQQKVVSYGKITSQTIKEQRESLPVFQKREGFLEMIRNNQICVVVGETGSGKTTQMAQYLLEDGFGERGIIGCTQPRRVAATSVAERVAEEVGCELGTTVGYSVRFDDKTTPGVTKIKYMTDGMLLREILLDPVISRYSVMIIDEAHERSTNTDVLLALIKAACKQRKDLRFIVTSATLNSAKFSTYLNNCPIFEIPGRSYPVEIYYSLQPEVDYFEAAIRSVMELHLTKPKGDILLFLTGEEEINDAVEMLEHNIKQVKAESKVNIPELDIFPIYSSLPNEMQSRIFEPTPPGRRKCVVSTNIAEASVTIDGIVYVIDTGVYKVSVYDPKQNMESLQITPISQAQAKQRSGRAGRTQAGECYRLYTEHSFKAEMTPTPVPELQRCDLTSVILLLKALGINDLLGFDFIDPPSTSSMLLALRQLYWLGAVDNDGLLTPVGARLAMLPVSPNLGKMLLVAADLGCVQEMATVVALVSGDELWMRPKNSQDEADRARAKFSLREGDHATLVNVFNQWEAEGKNKHWVAKHFLSLRALEGAHKVKLQLLRTLSNMKVELSSCGKNWTTISRCVAAGLFMNAAKREVTEDKSSKNNILNQQKTQITYTTLTYGNSAPIHPASTLASQMPQFIVYQKLLLTTKEWLHTCTIIHPQWLIQLAPHLYAARNDLTTTRNSRQNRLQEMTDPHNAAGAWRLSRRMR